MANKLEVEGKEILIKSSKGIMAVIPKDMVSWVKSQIESGKHDVVDKYVNSLKEFKYDNQKAADGLYANIHAKRARIAAGSGERMRKPGSPGAPTAEQFKQAAKTAKAEDGVMIPPKTNQGENNEYTGRTLKEVVITSPEPLWLKYKKQYEEKNPKSSYIEKYLTPLARALGNSQQAYPPRLDEEYNRNLYSGYINNLLNNFSFEFTPKEQELVDRYAKTERDKQLYNFLKSDQEKKNSKNEYLKAVGNLTFDTVVDQLPDLASKYKGNPYIDNLLKLPHLNKIKAGYQFFYNGRPLTALSELAKIPGFSSVLGDAAINVAQENPKGFDLASLEDKYLSPVRLASIKNDQVITQIGEEILKNKNLPSVIEAANNFGKKYNTSPNDFVNFVENYMVGRGKSYAETLGAYEKYLQATQNKNK